MKKLRIAIIGCGAIAERHLAAVNATAEAVCTALLDPAPARAEGMRRRLAHAAMVVQTIGDLIPLADAVIIAAPSSEHHRLTIEALRVGLHVLCEKPLATTAAHAEELVAEAERYNRVLACGLVRRFIPSVETMIVALRMGVLGAVRGVRVRESVVDWPFSEAALRSSGGGVLLDTGPHVLDLVSQFLGEPRLVSYEDDATDRYEASASVELNCGEGSIPVSLRLARGVRFRSLWTFECERGTLRLDSHVFDKVEMEFTAVEQRLQGQLKAAGGDPFQAQLLDFVRAVESGTDPRVPGRATIPVLRLIEQCYARRAPMPEPWNSGPVLGPLLRVAGPQPIFITGSTGRIGTRLIEMWTAAGRKSRLRCAVRNHHNAARLHRFDVDVRVADLLDRKALVSAMAGCAAIVHLGAGEKPGQETEAVASAALEAGVPRLVHMSSAAVYGLDVPSRVEELQEATPLVKTGQLYADGKIAAERALGSAIASGLETTILRPQVVYGPGMRWNVELVELLAQDRLAILHEPGICNLIYVDDVVRAVDSGLEGPALRGETFFITDGIPRTWREYIEAHAVFLGITVPVVTQDAPSKSSWMRASLRPLAPVLRTDEFRTFVTESPLMKATAFRAYLGLREHPWIGPRLRQMRQQGGENEPAKAFDRLWLDLQRSKARLDSSRAASRLGFHAAVPFSEGLRRTADWLRHHGLIPAR